MGSSTEGKASSGEEKDSFGGILLKLRKRRIIETLAAFIGGGWLLVNVVEWLLLPGNYKLAEKTIDLAVVSVVGALLATLVWRWFRSSEKRPGNIKIEVLVAPLIALATTTIDLDIIFRIAGIQFKGLMIGGIALVLGIAWVILKLSQWAN